MNEQNGTTTSLPSFSSFPAAPVFDSFPVASTSKARLPSTQSSESEEDKRSKKSRSSKDKERHHKERKHRPEDGSDREHKRSKRRENDERVDRHKRREDDTTASKDKDRSSRHSRKHDKTTSDDERKRKSRKREEEAAKQYYNVPDLASGEVAHVVRQHKTEQYDSEFSSIPDYKIFTLDGKGDQEVRRYGKPYRGSIPRYRRIGFGHVIGLPGAYKITLESAREGDHLDVVAGRDYSKHRITDRSFKRLILAPTMKAIQSPSYNDSQLNGTSDYIKLPSTKLAKDKVAQLEHEEGQDYRSVAGYIKPDDVQEGDEWDGLDAADEEEAESFDDYLKRRNVEFERHLRSNPNDVKAWLDLVAFQDVVHNVVSDEATKAQKRIQTQISRRSLADIKISILERALSQSGNEDSTNLHLAIMKYGADIWDTKELMRRWMELLKDKPEEMEVWLEYLTFRQTNAVVFSVQEVVEVYVDCLQRIAKHILRNPRGSREREKLEENYLYLFLRVCLLLRQSDFAERALAAFQAMVELNFYMPDQHRGTIQTNPTDLRPVEAALNDLETFWDAESPRVGEAGSVGWCNTAGDAEIAAPPSEQSMATAEASAPVEEDPFTRWAKAERQASRARRRPSRTTDMEEEEDEEDDPYSIILFSDIRPLLFVVSSPDARSQLLYSFLFYLGLPLTPPDTPTTSRLASDTFLHADDFSPSFAAKKRADFWPTQSTDEFLRALIPFDMIGGQAMEPVRTSGIKDPFQPPFRKFPISPDSLFPATPRWFCLLDQKEYLQELDLPFVRNVLAQIRLVSKDIFLTLAHFSLEATVNGKGAVKIAKNVLKNDSKNLLFWDAYARIERSNGNLKAARNVYMQALSLSQGFEEKEKVDMPLLWRAWAELEWEDGKEDVALAVLAASSANPIDVAALGAIAKSDILSKPSPASTLRARQYYRRLLDLANADDSPQSLFRHRASITFCLALLEYLVNGLDACNTCMVRQVSQLQNESPASAEEEEVLALQAKIAFRHTQSRTAFRPGTLRTILEGALRTFPNNSIFLSMHLFNEARTRIANRVRRVIDDVILKDDSVTTEGWLFAIYAELHLNGRTYNAEAVRALFERATDHPRTKASVSLWSLYIDFELRQGKTRRAKRLLHRALVECPWAKDLYIMAFTPPFREAYRSAEIREIHRLMLEKGIRLHKSLESTVAGWRSEASEDEMDQDALETEDSLFAQRQAAERLRLMPV